MTGNKQARPRGGAARGGASRSGTASRNGAAGRNGAANRNEAASRNRAASRTSAANRGGGRAPAGAARPRRPLPKGEALYTPGSSAGRRAVERRSAALLVYLHQLPRWVPPVVLAALLITGLAVHGIGGGIALAGVALLLLWLAVVSWPSLPPTGRVIRVLVIALVIGAAVVQVTR